MENSKFARSAASPTPASLTISVLATLLLILEPAAAGEFSSESCPAGNRPAASLLIPYFEVDLADPAGTTTLFSIGNALDRPVIAHVVMWTDWGIPTQSFDLILDASQVRSVNVRSLLSGQFPFFGDPALVPEAPACELSLPPPPIDLDELRARHTGQASPFSGLCFGSGLRGPDVATGFLTVDVVRDCSAGALPMDGDYFDDGLGLATNDNALFGDFFLMAPGEDLAQGLTAVSLVADTDFFEPTAADPFPPFTFYSPWTDDRDADDRSPLPHRYRTRFLRGGGFDGETDLLIWTAGVGANASPQECGGGPWPASISFPFLRLDFRDQAGDLVAEEFVTLPAATFRYSIGHDGVPIEPNTFGTVEIETTTIGCFLLLPCVDNLQSWVSPLVGAEGRFSIGLEATALDNPCR